MSVIADDEIIDQTDYEEFEGVPDRTKFVEETTEDDDNSNMDVPHPELISPNWQLETEHTFVQEHFCKVTSCTYAAPVVGSYAFRLNVRSSSLCGLSCSNTSSLSLIGSHLNR